MKTDVEYMRGAIDFMASSSDFPDDYEDVNDILTGLSMLVAITTDPNAIKIAIEAAFQYGWQRRKMTEVDREVWGDM